MGNGKVVINLHGETWPGYSTLGLGYGWAGNKLVSRYNNMCLTLLGEGGGGKWIMGGFSLV
jgi:hypothetical protein